MKLGDIDVAYVRVGNTKITSAYIGDTLVYTSPFGPEYDLTAFNIGTYQGGSNAYGACVLVVPSKNVVVNEMAIFSTGREATGSKENSFLTVVYELSSLVKTAGQYQLTTIMNHTNAVLWNNSTSEWDCFIGYEQDGYTAVEKVYGIPTELTVDDSTVTAYKYKIKRSTGSFTLEKGKAYLIGYQAGIYDSEEQGASVKLKESEDVVTNDYNQIVKCAMTLAKNTSYTEGSTVYFTDLTFYSKNSETAWTGWPYIYFNDEPFYAFGEPTEPMTGDSLSTLNIDQRYSFGVDDNTGGAYVFMPASDVTVSKIISYYKYSKISNSTTGSVLGYIAELSDNTVTATQTVMLNPDTAAFVYNASTDITPMYDVSGVENTLVINDDDYSTYMYTYKPADNSSITFYAGHTYLVGFSTSVYPGTSSYAETVLLSRTSADTEYNKIAKVDKTFSLSAMYENTYGLPYLIFDGTAFKDYARASYTKSELRTDSFNHIDNVYRALSSTDKLILVIRHAERGSDYSQTAELNDTGKRTAEQLGKVLTGGSINVNDCYYGATDYTRTCQTAGLIASGRGDTNFNDPTKVYALASFDGHTDNVDSDLAVIAQYYCYGGSSPGSWNAVIAAAKANDMDTNVPNIVNALINKVNEKDVRLGIFASHDYCVVPLIAYASGSRNNTVGKIELTYDDGTWVNYMSGIAIVVDTTKSSTDTDYYKMYPVRGLSGGTSEQ